MTKMVSSGDTSTALSVLYIDNVHLKDRGNYTCKPASGGQASISLHVLEGNIIENCQEYFTLRYLFSQSLLVCVAMFVYS